MNCTTNCKDFSQKLNTTYQWLELSIKFFLLIVAIISFYLYKKVVRQLCYESLPRLKREGKTFILLGFDSGKRFKPDVELRGISHKVDIWDGKHFLYQDKDDKMHDMNCRSRIDDDCECCLTDAHELLNILFATPATCSDKMLEKFYKEGSTTPLGNRVDMTYVNFGGTNDQDKIKTILNTFRTDKKDGLIYIEYTCVIRRGIEYLILTAFGIKAYGPSDLNIASNETLYIAALTLLTLSLVSAICSIILAYKKLGKYTNVVSYWCMIISLISYQMSTLCYKLPEMDGIAAWIQFVLLLSTLPLIIILAIILMKSYMWFETRLTSIAKQSGEVGVINLIVIKLRSALSVMVKHFSLAMVFFIIMFVFTSQINALSPINTIENPKQEYYVWNDYRSDVPDPRTHTKVLFTRSVLYNEKVRLLRKLAADIEDVLQPTVKYTKLRAVVTQKLHWSADLVPIFNNFGTHEPMVYQSTGDNNRVYRHYAGKSTDTLSPIQSYHSGLYVAQPSNFSLPACVVDSVRRIMISSTSNLIWKHMSRKLNFFFSAFSATAGVSYSCITCVGRDEFKDSLKAVYKTFSKVHKITDQNSERINLNTKTIGLLKEANKVIVEAIQTLRVSFYEFINAFTFCAKWNSQYEQKVLPVMAEFNAIDEALGEYADMAGSTAISKFKTLDAKVELVDHFASAEAFALQNNYILVSNISDEYSYDYDVYSENGELVLAVLIEFETRQQPILWNLFDIRYILSSSHTCQKRILQAELWTLYSSDLKWIARGNGVNPSSYYCNKLACKATNIERVVTTESQKAKLRNYPKTSGMAVSNIDKFLTTIYNPNCDKVIVDYKVDRLQCKLAIWINTTDYIHIVIQDMQVDMVDDEYQSGNKILLYNLTNSGRIMITAQSYVLPLDYNCVNKEWTSEYHRLLNLTNTEMEQTSQITWVGEDYSSEIEKFANITNKIDQEISKNLNKSDMLYEESLQLSKDLGENIKQNLATINAMSTKIVNLEKLYNTLKNGLTLPLDLLKGLKDELTPSIFGSFSINNLAQWIAIILLYILYFCKQRISKVMDVATTMAEKQSGIPLTNIWEDTNEAEKSYKYDDKHERRPQNIHDKRTKMNNVDINDKGFSHLTIVDI